MKYYVSLMIEVTADDADAAALAFAGRLVRSGRAYEPLRVHVTPAQSVTPPRSDSRTTFHRITLHGGACSSEREA